MKICLLKDRNVQKLIAKVVICCNTTKLSAETAVWMNLKTSGVQWYIKCLRTKFVKPEVIYGKEWKKSL